MTLIPKHANIITNHNIVPYLLLFLLLFLISSFISYFFFYFLPKLWFNVTHSCKAIFCRLLPAKLILHPTEILQLVSLGLHITIATRHESLNLIQHTIVFCLLTNTLLSALLGDSVCDSHVTTEEVT